MVNQIAADDWLAPGMNQGCVVRMSASGEVMESFWDPTGEYHTNVTSMREHKGYLYLGGLENNRIGRIKFDQGDSNWTGYESYWGTTKNEERQ